MRKKNSRVHKKYLYIKTKFIIDSNMQAIKESKEEYKLCKQLRNGIIMYI